MHRTSCARPQSPGYACELTGGEAAVRGRFLTAIRRRWRPGRIAALRPACRLGQVRFKLHARPPRVGRLATWDRNWRCDLPPATCIDVPTPTPFFTVTAVC